MLIVSSSASAGLFDDLEDAADDLYEKTKDKTKEIINDPSGTAEDIYNKGKEVTEDFIDDPEGTIDDAYDKTKDVTKDVVRKTEEITEDAVRETTNEVVKNVDPGYSLPATSTGGNNTPGFEVIFLLLGIALFIFIRKKDL